MIATSFLTIMQRPTRGGGKWVFTSDPIVVSELTPVRPTVLLV